jgi:hypothetical protein
MCFASLGKGYAAVAVQAVATASRLGVLPDFTDALRQLAPGNLDRVERAVVGMAPKAYRWVREMEEISETHAGISSRLSGLERGKGEGEGEGEEDFGFNPEFIFRGAADVFRIVAEDTVLGQERVGTRNRGTTLEDVAEAVAEGLRERKKRKTTGGNQENK